jgi:hypothetical protein
MTGDPNELRRAELETEARRLLKQDDPIRRVSLQQFSSGEWYIWIDREKGFGDMGPYASLWEAAQIAGGLR